AMPRRVPRNTKRREDGEAQGNKKYALTVVCIGDMAGRNCENDQRQKLNKTHVTESHRGTGSFVNSPADRNFQHLLAHHKNREAAEIPPIGWEPERSVRIVPRHSCHMVARRGLFFIGRGISGTRWDWAPVPP